MTSRRLIAIMFGAVIALVTDCGGGSSSAPASHPSTSSSHSSSSSSAGTTSNQKSSGGIPQNGVGDHDADNSGGPATATETSDEAGGREQRACASSGTGPA